MTDSKVDNIVKIIAFEGEDDLYAQLDKYLLTDSIMEGKCSRLKNIQLMDKNHALLYFEEDTEVIAVQFVNRNGEYIQCEDCAFDKLHLPYSEIQLMNEFGEVTIEDSTYDIENMKYCINSMGGRFIEIHLA